MSALLVCFLRDCESGFVTSNRITFSTLLELPLHRARNFSPKTVIFLIQLPEHLVDESLQTL